MPESYIEVLKNLYHRLVKSEVFRRIIKNSSYLLSATGVTMIFSIIQGVFIFRLIGPEGSGLLGAIQQFTNTANRLTSFRINEVIVRYVRQYEEQKDQLKAAAIFKMAGLFEMAGAFVAFGLIWQLSSWGASFFGQDQSSASLWVLYGLVVIVMFLYESSTGLLQVFDYFKQMAIINVIQGGFSLLMILFVFFSGGGFREVLIVYILSKTIGAVGVTGVAFYVANKMWGKGWWQVSIRVLSKDRRDLSSFIFSTNVSDTVTLIARESETLWVSAFLGLEQAGYYREARKIVGLLKLPISPLGKTSYPEITREITQKKWKSVKEILDNGSKLAAVFSLPIILGVLILGKPVLGFVYGVEWLPAYPLLLILLVGFTIDNIYFWNRIALLALNRPVFPTIINIIGLGLKILGIFILTAQFEAFAFAGLLSGYMVFTALASAFRVYRDLIAQQKKELIQ